MQAKPYEKNNLYGCMKNHMGSQCVKKHRFSKIPCVELKTTVRGPLKIRIFACMGNV